jgi:hypothetical protein
VRDRTILVLTLCLGTAVYSCRPPAEREPAEPHPAAKRGMVDAALYAAERMGSEEVHAGAARRIALLYSGGGAVDEALSLAREIPLQENRERTLADVAIELAEGGDRERAQAIAREIDSEYHASRVLAATAVAYERAEEYRRGRELAATIGDPNYRARAFAGIGAIYYAEGYGDLASRLFNQALDAVRREQSITHHVETLSYIAQKYNEAGQTRRAIETFSEAVDLSGKIGSEQHLLTVWGGMLAAYRSAGASDSVIDDAVGAARSMGERGDYYRDELLSRAAAAYAAIGAFERMRDALDGIGDAPLRTATRARSAAAAFDYGDMDTGAKLLAEAADSSGEIQSDIFRQRAQWEVGAIAAEAGRYDTVDRILEMLEDPQFAGRLAADAANAALDLGDNAAFERYLGRLFAAMQEAKERADKVDLLVSLAELHYRSGRDLDGDSVLAVSRVLYRVE